MGMIMSKRAENKLASKTPAEIDAMLADLTGQLDKLDATRDSIVGALHSNVGDKIRYIGRKRVWTMTDDEVMRAAAKWELLALHLQAQVKTRLERLSEIYQERVVLLMTIGNLDREYARRPWSRFFEVTSSNGHVHSSMSCSTCRVTTGFGWHPELSGTSEEDAVAQLGPFLCSVCFASAPVEWKRDRSEVKNATRDESLYCQGARGVEGSYRWTYSPTAICDACGERRSVTSTGKIRRHKK
jgi:hypothetical protein